jgi:hypothetical protein
MRPGREGKHRRRGGGRRRRRPCPGSPGTARTPPSSTAGLQEGRDRVQRAVDLPVAVASQSSLPRASQGPRGCHRRLRCCPPPRTAPQRRQSRAEGPWERPSLLSGQPAARHPSPRQARANTGWNAALKAPGGALGAPRSRGRRGASARKDEQIYISVSRPSAATTLPPAFFPQPFSLERAMARQPR